MRFARHVVAAFVTSVAAAVPTFAADITFDTPGDYGTPASPTQFSFSTTSGSTWYAEANGVGVGGTRGLGLMPTGSDISSNYVGTGSVFDFSAFGSVMETSLMFKKVTAGNPNATSRIFDLGVLPASNVFLNGGSHAGVRFRSLSGQPNGIDIRFRNNNADAGTASAATLVSGNFYKLTFRLTNVDGYNLNFQSWIDDYGTTGLSLVSATPLVSIAGLFANSTLAADASVYGGFRVRNENNANAVSALDNFSVNGVTGTSYRPPRTFTHPGLLNNAGEIAHFAAQAEAGVGLWSQGYQKVATGVNDAGVAFINHTPQPATAYTAAVHWSQPGIARSLLDDARAAYANALIWKVTDNAAHAGKARETINAWTGTMTTILNSAGNPMTAADSRQDYMLYTSYSWPAMIWTAELLRSDTSSGWTASDDTVFKGFLTNIVRPAVEHSSNNLNNNWASWRIAYKVSDAAYTEDTVRFEQAMQEWRTHVSSYIGANLYGEMQRDLWHSQMGLAGILSAAEVALKQGVDLYSYNNNQLLRCLEYQIPFYLGDYTNWPFSTAVVPGVQVDGATLWNIYEMAYNHYHNRLGLPTPNLEAMLNALAVKPIPNPPADGRPYRAEDFFRTGYGTLTHAGDGTTYAVLAGFDPTFTLAQQHLAATGTGSVTLVTDPTPGQSSNGVLKLTIDAAQTAGVARTFNFEEKLDVSFDYRFNADGELVITLNGNVIASIDAPADGLGRDFFQQYRESFLLSALGLAPGNHVFAVELRGTAASELWLDNLFVTSTFVAPFLPADFNQDGKVDVADLGILATYWNGPGTRAQGDANNDGVVDVGDLGLLASDWGAGTTTSLSLHQAMDSVGLGDVAIPEPATLALAGLGAAALLRRRR